ncbi:MAG TPA: serine protease [Solirubrobacteraceae bacterium]
MRTTRTALLAALVTLVVATPACAVIGGRVIEPAAVPWFAYTGNCGAMLVAPNRLVTASHCVAQMGLTDLSHINVGGVTTSATRFAMYPSWRRDNGGNVLDDVAIIEFAQPVAAVAPVTLGGLSELPAEARIVGRGRAAAPGSGASLQQTFDGNLREAILRPMTDTKCARLWQRHKGNSGERFDGARMICAIDIDGRPPLSSGCNGDSGGPLYAGTPDAPVLLGIVSWGGAGCGADHLPSVFADVERYRDFITSPSPAWAPTTASAAKITDRRRVGARLTCTASGFATAPTKLAVLWNRQGGGRGPRAVSGKTYTVRKADRGRRLACSIQASNAGGVTSVPFSDRLSVVRIAR